MSLEILLTNDDGIFAEGLQVLGQILFEETAYHISIVAPDHERSAVGHAITMHRPLRADKVRFLHNRQLQGWSVNGTPSDCVKLAVEAILPIKPQLTISGINRGGNLGTDVLYSGTVSAAVESIILGIPAVAVSLIEEGETEDFYTAARFIRDLIPKLLGYQLPPGTLLNINVPPASRTGIRGVRATRLGTRHYGNTFEKRFDPRGRAYYWMAGELVEGEEPEDSDVRAVGEGYISITPIHLNLTNDRIIPDLKDIISKLNISCRT